MNARSRAIAFAAAALVAVVVVVFAVGRFHGAPPSTAGTAQAAPAVSTARARFEPFVRRVVASGRVGAPAGSQAKLSFAGSGLVRSIDITVGERVAAGQTLAQLDARALEIDAAAARADAAAAAASYGGGSVPGSALASARARLAAAQQRLATARRQSGSANSDVVAARSAARQSAQRVAADETALERAQQLFSAGVAARKDVDAARSQLLLDRADDAANASKARAAAAAVGGAAAQAYADYQQATNDVRTARAQIGITGAQAASASEKLAQAERAVESATLRAPQAGTVIAILKHVGEAVDPSQPVVIVGPQSDRAVTLTVAGEDGALTRVGDSVVVSDAARHSSASGRITAVVPAVDPTTQTTTVVTAAVPADSAPGNAVTAAIDVATYRGIVVPATALIDDPQSGKTLVFVRTVGKNGDQKFEPHEVSVTASDGARALIRGGLRNGDIVAAQGAFDLLAPGSGG